MNKDSRSKLESIRIQLNSIRDIEDGEFDCLSSAQQDGQEGGRILDSIDALKDIDRSLEGILSGEYRDRPVVGISDELIEAIFGIGPFAARDTCLKNKHKGKFEVVENIGDDPTVVSNEQRHHGFFNDWDEANKVQRRLHVRWALSHNSEVCNTACPDFFEIVLRVLNEAHEADPAAMESLVNVRVPCSAIMADHPTIRVGAMTTARGETFEVGLIGIINGITEAATGRRFAGELSDDGESRLVRFIPYRPNSKGS